MTVPQRVLLQVMLALAAMMMISSPVTAFAGIRHAQYRLKVSAPSISRAGNNINIIQRRRGMSFQHLDAKGGDDDEDDGSEPFLNDQREGMADAFSALDSLTADDFDDLKPLSSTADTSTSTDSANMEESAKLFMEMQAELSSKGETGVYDDVLGDLTGDTIDVDDAPKYNEDKDDITMLGKALDEAADASVLDDADGFASLDSSDTLTTSDVSSDVLSQEIKPSLSMEDFMSSAIEEAVAEVVADEDTLSPSGGTGRTEDIAKTAEELLEDEELRKDIEGIFDRAGEKLRLEVDAMKKEQAAVTREASQKGDEYLELEKQRISEAEASVTRLIQKVAKETDSVQKAMEDLERAKREASGEDGGMSIENTALDLKEGGLVKQASLVGGLLFGSRAITETILVVSSPYGDEHFVPAIVQATIAVACAAYFFLVR